MKFGFRKPSIKKSLKAMTTARLKRAVKSAVNPLYGKKGMGWINDPKKAAYNAVYRRTTVSVGSLLGLLLKGGKQPPARAEKNGRAAVSAPPTRAFTIASLPPSLKKALGFYFIAFVAIVLLMAIGPVVPFLLPVAGIAAIIGAVYGIYLLVSFIWHFWRT